MDYPGEKLLGKMWDTLADKGMGMLLKPWQTRREARAQADVTVLLAQAEKDANDIRAGKKVLSGTGSAVRLIEATPTAAPSELMSDGRKEPSLNLDLIVQSATQVQAAQAVREEVNVARAVLHAEATLANDPSPAPDVSVDGDWLYRWRDSAASVSSEQMQSLWGSVLAGEVKQPGRFSLRTLDFLRNLSVEEARAIEDQSQFIIAGCIPKYGSMSDEGTSKTGIATLLLLQELGLVSGVGATGLSLTINGEGTAYFRTLIGEDKGIAVRHQDPAKLLQLKIYRVTPLGQQVFGLANRETDKELLFATAQACQGQGFKVSTFDAIPIPEKPGSYRMKDEVFLPEPASPLPEQVNTP